MMTYNLPHFGSWNDIPDHLKTKTSVKKMGLRLVRGQEPVAIKARWKHSGPYYLYDITQCEPAKPLSEAQQLAIAKAQAASRKMRTCQGCGYVSPLREGLKTADWRCDDCEFDGMIRDAYRESILWAREVLADEKAVILDTETTGLDGEVIEVAICDVTGKPLFDRLIKPTCEIEPGAARVHGITNEMLKFEPTFAQVHEELGQLLDQASRIVIYNVEFDYNVLKNSCRAHNLPSLEWDKRWQCAMKQYARYYGEWSHYHKSFTWQRLNGGHRAMGDCLACLEKIKEMAASDPDDEPLAYG